MDDKDSRAIWQALDKLVARVDQLASDLATLRAVVDAAPHGDSCPGAYGWACVCWKQSLIKKETG